MQRYINNLNALVPECINTPLSWSPIEHLKVFIIDSPHRYQDAVMESADFCLCPVPKRIYPWLFMLSPWFTVSRGFGVTTKYSSPASMVRRPGGIRWITNEVRLLRVIVQLMRQLSHPEQPYTNIPNLYDITCGPPSSIPDGHRIATPPGTDPFLFDLSPKSCFYQHYRKHFESSLISNQLQTPSSTTNQSLETARSPIQDQPAKPLTVEGKKWAWEFLYKYNKEQYRQKYGEEPDPSWPFVKDPTDVINEVFINKPPPSKEELDELQNYKRPEASPEASPQLHEPEREREYTEEELEEMLNLTAATPQASTPDEVAITPSASTPQADAVQQIEQSREPKLDLSKFLQKQKPKLDLPPDSIAYLMQGRKNPVSTPEE